MRHRRNHFLIHRHLFLNRALHANQTDAELIFKQLADGANTSISKVVDIIHLADTLAKLQQVCDNGVEIRRLQNAPEVVGAGRAIDVQSELRQLYGDVALDA